MGLLKSINAQFVTGIMALALLALLAWTFAGWLTYSEPVNFSPDIGVENGDGTYTLPDGTIFLPDQPKAYTYQPAAPLNTERSVGVEHEYLPSGKYSDYPDAGYIDTYSDYIGYGYTRKDVCGKNDCTLHIPAYNSTYTPPFNSTYTPSSARVQFPVLCISSRSPISSDCDGASRHPRKTATSDRSGERKVCERFARTPRRIGPSATIIAAYNIRDICFDVAFDFYRPRWARRMDKPAPITAWFTGLREVSTKLEPWLTPNQGKAT